jgi:hypothetical protein
MDKNQATEWLRRYELEEDYNNGLEEKLRTQFKKNQSFTKSDLLEIMKWKFETMQGREKRQQNLLKTIKDEDVVHISTAAFRIKDDRLRIAVLMTIPSVGLAIASTVMTFYAPENYGIYDIHSWRGLMCKKEFQSATWKELDAFWTKLRKEAKKLGMTCRDLEKAYFKKDKEAPVTKY